MGRYFLISAVSAWIIFSLGCTDVAVQSSDEDADADGYDNAASGGDDCNDSDPEINPGAEEVCDGVDNDCDEAVDCDDEDVADADADGVCACEDCDDLDADNFPGNSEICDDADNDCDGVVDNDLLFSDWYEDADGDGHGRIDDPLSTCDGPPDDDWVEVGDDCDDLDPDNYPGNEEVCDGQDNDCDELADCEDDVLDADADGSCQCDDCDDLDPENFDGNAEVCDDADNDCDGFADCDDPDMADLDGDGVCECEDCDDVDADNYPGNAEVCDGADNDCDTDVDCDDSDAADLDGDGVCECDDCDDLDPDNYPGNVEQCDDQDNDCDGLVDEDIINTPWYYDTDGDGHGNPAVVQSTCDGSPGAGWVSVGDDCDDADPYNFPGNIESCDGQDNDCDYLVDEGLTFQDWYADADGDGHGDPYNTQSTCDGTPGIGWVTVGDDCDDGDPYNYPGNTEVCDGQDNDCDWIVDEGCSEICDNGVDDDGDGLIDCDDPDCIGDPACAGCSCIDADGDGYYPTTCADPLCTPATDCDDTDPDNYPGNPEVCDGGDNDCDGDVDCDDVDIPDADGDGWCECEDCDDTDPGVGAGSTEICDGLDNDCDGDVDEDFWSMNVGSLSCAIDPASPVCSDAAVTIASNVVDVDMSLHSGITIALYTLDPTGYAWNVGDSPSNNCCCGDGSDRSHDAEVYGTGGNDVGICSQDGSAWVYSWADLLPAAGAGWFEVSISPSFVRLLGDNFCEEYTSGAFPLTGYDSEAGADDDQVIHIGMNQVVAGGRTGTGLDLVELYWWP